jgi:hypothetical protein
MRRALTLLAVLAALVAAGCGGEEEPTIPSENADRLVDLLRQARVQAGDQDRCDKLADLVDEIRAEVDALPNGVDRDTRRTLDDGVANLEELAREECEGVETTETETTPTETETTPPPTETETVPPPTETEPPPTETEPPPPEEIPEEPGNGGVPEEEGGGNQPGFVPPGQEKKGRDE